VKALKKPVWWIVLIVVTQLLQACGSKEERMITGDTMGTSYHIKVVTPHAGVMPGLQRSVRHRLEAINGRMSIYVEDSEINRFNTSRDLEHTFSLSDDLYRIILVAKRLHAITGGGWDGTLQPVLDLWGFGPAGESMAHKIPDRGEIEKRMSSVGFDKIELTEHRSLTKSTPDVSLDLNSIAKGYAVDQIASLLAEHGMEDFLVEIGGETVARGAGKRGGPWRVGINFPRPDAAPDSVYRVVHLEDAALATSGDYRRFFEAGGTRYSHVFDPETGFPVDNGVVSVSVIAESCAFADGLATALMVLGPAKGLPLVDGLEGVECMIVTEGPGSRLTDHYSRGFRVVE